MTFLKRLFLILVGSRDPKSAADPLFGDLSDEELVAKIVANNNTLMFGVLYDRYVKMVYNKCYGFARSSAEAEDLTQDIFLMLFVKLPSFKGMSKFSTWLYSFTYNFCVNYVNRNKQRKMKDKSVAIENTEYKLTDDEISDESVYELKAERLEKALEKIAVEDKSILLLKYQDGASVKELATVLQLGESAIKMRLKRAKAKLVEAYEKITDG